MVRPNQGLIPPGSTEEVQILLVDKDKAQLLQSYQRLGQAALDHCKDKFLVQSTAVTPQFCEDYQATGGDGSGYDKLSALWAAVTSANSGTTVANKKLHVRHVAVEASSAASAGAPPPRAAGAGSMPAKLEVSGNPADMSQEQLMGEMTNLRRKYDELVAFSVNLTAERDILNNTLEQTKRDLNRELLNRNSSAAQGGRGGGGAAQQAAPAKSGGFLGRLLKTAFVAAVFFGLGVRMEGAGSVEKLKSLPIVGPLLLPPEQQPEAVSSPPKVDTAEKKPEPVSQEL